jgi:hypothetical protein
MNSYYGCVNGPSCHYKKLARYSKCSEAEVAATAVPTTTDYVKPKPGASTGAAGEKFEYISSEGFEVAGATGAPAAPESPAAPAETTVKPEYTPSYSVPNYPPINIDSLTYGGRGCAGYPSIIDAYSGGGMMSSAGSCTTNFINN